MQASKSTLIDIKRCSCYELNVFRVFSKIVAETCHPIQRLPEIRKTTVKLSTL